MFVALLLSPSILTQADHLSRADVFNTEAHPFKAPAAKDVYGSTTPFATSSHSSKPFPLASGKLPKPSSNGIALMQGVNLLVNNLLG
jgi:hypothetical protein